MTSAGSKESVVGIDWKIRLPLLAFALTAPLGNGTVGFVLLFLALPWLYKEAKRRAEGWADGKALGAFARPVAAFIGAALVSSLLGVDVQTGLVHTLGLALLAVVGVTAGTIAGGDDRFLKRQFMPVVMASFIVSLAWAVYQYFGLGVRSISGLFSESDRYGILITYFGILGIGYLLSFPGQLRLWAVPFGALALAALNASLSRAGWVSTGVGGVLMALKPGWRGVAVLIVVGLLFAVSLQLEPRWGERFAQVTWDQPRAELWKGALAIYKDYPVLGVGPGNFPRVSPQYIENPARWRHATPHNVVLNIAVDMGTVGLLAFGWVMLTAGRMALFLWRNGDMFAAAVAVAFVGIYVHDLFTQRFYTVQLGSVMWFALGLVQGVYANMTGAARPTSAAGPEPGRASP